MGKKAKGSGIPPEILDYYGRSAEGSRLETGVFRLEAERTREILSRELPPPPATILDVGGGSGPYSIWLAGLGYEARLVEPVPRLLEEARRRSAAAPRPLASIKSGDARRLDCPAASADAVLLLGPLYHLTGRKDRIRSLKETFRVLKPGGKVLAAGISRYASALGGVSLRLCRDVRFTAIRERDLADGQHRNETAELEYFTTAYFHLPRELREETQEGGFERVRVIGIEGPGWILPDFDQRWDDPQLREDLLWLARALEAEESVVGASAHLLAIGEKEGGAGSRRKRNRSRGT